MKDPFSPKQYEFLSNCTATWNLAHGSVRTGKTIVTLYALRDTINYPRAFYTICLKIKEIEKQLQTEET